MWFFRDRVLPNLMSQLLKTHQYFLKQRFFVLNVKDGLSAVNCIKPLWGEVSLCAVTYFKLNLVAQRVMTKFKDIDESYNLKTILLNFQLKMVDIWGRRFQTIINKILIILWLLKSTSCTAEWLEIHPLSGSTPNSTCLSTHPLHWP